MRKIIILLLSVLIVSMVLSGCNKTNYDNFAKCLTEKGATMYGTEWCTHCKSQKEAFGKSFQYINFVDCDRSKIECTEAGVEGYPTWKISGVNYPGKQEMYKLASLTKCDIQ